MACMIAVVMGVSSSGKTTVARILAERLGWRYQEGDDLHPPENVAKMASGHPLTDEDRIPWLKRIAEVIDGWRAEDVSGVLTCSALKHAYREIIIGDRPEVRLIYLHGSKALIADRMSHRKNHFMPTGLLDSQFATLEEPGDDERPLVAEVGPPPDVIVDEIIAKLERPAIQG